MAKPDISDIKKVIEYDPETGLFTRKVTRGRWKKGSTAGTIYRSQAGREYIQINICGRLMFGHRLAYLYMTGSDPYQIDHIDGNGLNNKWDNLRNVTPQENLRNQKLNAKNTSGQMGVWLIKKRQKWCAEIKVNSKKIHLGTFARKSEAIKARKHAERKYNFHPNHGRVV